MKKKELDLSEIAELLAQSPAGLEKIRKQEEAIDKLQRALLNVYKQQKPYVVPCKAEKNVIRFGIASDMHFGSMYTKVTALKAFYQRCADEGINLVLCAGDVLAGWNVYKGQEFELRPDARSWVEQRDVFLQEMPQIEGVTTVFITGNHDLSFKKLVGMNVGDELQVRRSDWKYVGADIADVVLTAPDGFAFKVRLLHPGGGTAYALSYHAQRIIESISGGQKPDLVVIGHYHKSLFIPQYRNVAAILAGCFEAQTPFMIRRSIAAHIGGWIVTVTGIERKYLTKRIQAEWIGFFEEKV